MAKEGSVAKPSSVIHRPELPKGGGDGGPAAKDSGFSAMGYRRRLQSPGQGGGRRRWRRLRRQRRRLQPGVSGGANGKERKPMPGGPVYGDEKLTDLFGGSGGAGGSNDRQIQERWRRRRWRRHVDCLGYLDNDRLAGLPAGTWRRRRRAGTFAAVAAAAAPYCSAAPKILIAPGATVDASGGDGATAQACRRKSTLGMAA